MALSLVAALAIALGALSFWRPMELQDEQLIVVDADQIRDGLVPHVDFFSAYGPATFGVVAAAFAALGAHTEVQRLVGLGYHLLIATALMYAVRPRGRRIAAAAAAVSLVAMFPLDLIAYAWLGGLALVTWQLALLVRHRGSGATAVAGVLGGLVPLWRPEMAVLSSVCLLPLLWGARRATWFAAGYAVGLIPLMVYLSRAGTEFVTNVFLNRLATDGRIPLSSLSGSAIVGAALIVGCTAVLAARALRSRDPSLRAAVLLALALWPQTFQRLDPDHVAFSACVIVPLACAAAWDRGQSAWLSPSRAWSVVALAGLLLVSVTYVAQRPLNVGVRVVAGDRSMLVDRSQVKATEDTLSAARSLAPPGSKAFVGATDMSVVTLSRMGLYHLLPEYRPSSYWLELPPAAVRAGSGLAQQIVSADLLLLTDVSASDNARFDGNPPGSPEANDAVRQHFCERGSTELAHLYVRCR